MIQYAQKDTTVQLELSMQQNIVVHVERMLTTLAYRMSLIASHVQQDFIVMKRHRRTTQNPAQLGESLTSLPYLSLNKLFPLGWRGIIIFSQKNKLGVVLDPFYLFIKLSYYSFYLPTLQTGFSYYCRQSADSGTPDQGYDADECPAGFYCPEGTEEPHKCPTGTYSDNVRLEDVSQCLNCTPGTFVKCMV